MKILRSLSLFWLCTLLSDAAAGARSLSQFEFVELNISGTVDDENITVLFNPKEYTVTKSTPWKHHNIQGLDAPTIEFTSGEPYRCQFDLFFDRYEEGKSVREITDQIEKLRVANNAGESADRIIVRWGKEFWETALLGVATEFLKFDANGNPIAAVVHTTWSSFVPLRQEEEHEGPPRFSPLAIQGANGRMAAWLNDERVELLHLIDPPLWITGQAIRVDSRARLRPPVRIDADEGFRLRLEVVVDTTRARSDARKQVAQFDALTAPDFQTGRSRVALLTLSSGAVFRGVLESFSTRFTLFLDDGTPVRAVMNTVWKEFSPAEEQLRGNPRH